MGSRWFCGFFAGICSWKSKLTLKPAEGGAAATAASVMPAVIDELICGRWPTTTSSLRRRMLGNRKTVSRTVAVSAISISYFGWLICMKRAYRHTGLGIGHNTPALGHYARANGRKQDYHNCTDVHSSTVCLVCELKTPVSANRTTAPRIKTMANIFIFPIHTASSRLMLYVFMCF